MRVIWVLLVATFVAILNETTMTMAMPHLITDLGIGPVTAQWATSAFMLTMAVVIPATGFLIRRFSTRQVFLAALGLFAGGTLSASFTVGFEMLLMGRVLQGTGTAILTPLLMTTIMNLVPPRSRGRMMGRVSIVLALAPAVGPALAGLLLDHFGWRSIFIVMLPIVFAATFVGWRWLTNIGETTKAPLDVLSVVLSAVGFGGIVYGLSQIGVAAHGAGADAASESVLTLWIALFVGMIALCLFGWRQVVLQRKDDALLDLRVFASPRFCLSIVQMFLICLVFFGALTIVPLYLQNALTLPALEAGLVVLPGALIMGLMSPPAGRIYDAHGPRPLVVPGAILVAGTLWYYTTLAVDTQIWLVVVSQIVLSVGLAMSFTPLYAASLGSLSAKLYSYGSAALGTMQQVAGAAGVAAMVAALTTVASQHGGTEVPEAVAAGTRTAFLVAAIVAALAVIWSFFVRKPTDDDSTAQFVGH